jgi:hypothetical protein
MQSGQQEYWLADSIVAEKAISRLDVGPVIASPWRYRAYVFQHIFAACCCFTRIHLHINELTALC